MRYNWIWQANVKSMNIVGLPGNTIYLVQAGHTSGASLPSMPQCYLHQPSQICLQLNPYIYILTRVVDPQWRTTRIRVRTIKSDRNLKWIFRLKCFSIRVVWPHAKINEETEIIGVCKHRLHVCDVIMLQHHNNCNSMQFTLHKLLIPENRPCRSHRYPADTNYFGYLLTRSHNHKFCFFYELPNFVHKYVVQLLISLLETC